MIDTSQCKKVGDLCGNGELDEEYEGCDSSSGTLPAEGTNAIFSEDYPTSGLCSDYEPDRYESGLLVCTDQCTINLSECVEKPNNESHYENGCSDEENNDVYFDKAEDCFKNDKENCLDCRDKDCDGFPGHENGSLCEFGRELSCNDGFDNDGDGLVDGEDSGDCIGNLQSYDGSFGVCSTQNRTMYGETKVNPCYHHDEGCVVSGTIMEDFICHNGVWYPRQGMGFALLQNKKANNVKIRCDSSPEKIFNNIDYFADLRDVSGILSSCVESACYLVSGNKKAVLLNVQPHELCIDSQSFPSYIFAEIGYDDFSNNDITSFESVDAGNGFYLFYNNYSKQLIYSNFGDFSPIFKDDESVLATLYKKLETQGKSELLKNASVIDSLMFYQEDNVKILGKKAREYNSEEERAGVWYQGTSKGFSDFFSLLFKEACADMGSACNFYPGNGGDLLFIGGKSETPLFSSWWPGYTSLLWESLVE
jgi:hypothetical protein